MSASLEETSPDNWTIDLDDTTQDWSFSKAFSCSTPGYTAEWIEEAPTVDGTLATLPDYGSTTFSNLGAAGTAISSAALYPMYVATSSGAIISYPADYSAATNSFSVFYGSPAPQVTSVTPDQGSTAGGAVVTGGRNFVTGVTAVDFGGVPVPFSADVPDGVVTAVALPQSARTVDITVTNPGGTSQLSSADQFTYVPPPPPRGLLARRLRWRDLCLRRRCVLRLDPWTRTAPRGFRAPELARRTDRRHGPLHRRWGLLHGRF
jgi:hypothetical protein